jgi:hypothetical protein
VVYTTESIVRSLIQDTPLAIASITSLSVVVVGVSSELRKLEFALRTRDIYSELFTSPRVSSLLALVSAACIFNLYIYCIKLFL